MGGGGDKDLYHPVRLNRQGHKERELLGDADLSREDLITLLK